MLVCAAAALLATAPVAMAQGNPPASSSALASPGYTPADVHFMQGMIGHHAQALEMAALVPERTTNASIHLLAERIEVSQKDEIALMRHWLEARHESAPDPNAKDQMAGHDMPGMSGMSTPMMPGMLTPEQMQQLAATKGTAFDRLFLTGMIQHHEGALAMVKDLFTKPGAGQEPETFQFASDVDVDQRAEIARMRALLVKLPASPK
jgi:uncharacterized protein (DUF305 family)